MEIVALFISLLSFGIEVSDSRVPLEHVATFQSLEQCQAAKGWYEEETCTESGKLFANLK